MQSTCLLCGSQKEIVQNFNYPICHECMQAQAQEVEIYQEQLQKQYENDPVKLNQASEMDTIIPGELYLGNYASASNLPLLQGNGIEQILVCCQFLKQRFPINFRYLQIPIQDSLNQSILEYLPQTNEFISKGITYVHCAAGINRSVAIVCAYLMYKYHWNYDQAFEFVKSKRSKANRQTNFANQLQSLEYK